MGHLGGEKIQHSEQLRPDQAGQRLDQAAAELFQGFSRSRLQSWIKSGDLTVDGKVGKPKQKLLGHEKLTLDTELAPELDDQPQALDLEVLHQDDDIMVINKPAGLVVHPAAGHADGTLLNGLLHLDERLNSLPRAGIVHRLDRDTTGVMVVARSLEAHQSLVAQLQDKSVLREYEAIAVGVMTGGGRVDQPLGRHPVDRKRQAVVKEGGRDAVSHYRLLERYRGHTRIKVQLETGRTHQIRVHMAYVRHPLVGDPLYGGRLKLPAGATEDLREALRRFHRQALHARRLGLIHPANGEYCEFQAPLPEDMQALIRVLEDDAKS